ncbi:hypothetical protein WAI453_009637 [Rhynchosporium graminicola]
MSPTSRSLLPADAVTVALPGVVAVTSASSSSIQPLTTQAVYYPATAPFSYGVEPTELVVGSDVRESSSQRTSVQ